MSKRVSLFVTCLTDLFFPEVGEDMVRLLRRLDLSVDFPRNQTCCGQPAFNSGFKQDSSMLARHFLEVFEDAEVIVTPSGSCATMVKKEYVHLFDHDPVYRARIKAVAERTFEFSEFLVDFLGIEDVGAAYQGRVTYHDACHMARALDLRDEPRKLLSHVRGLELVEMDRPDWCCGFGGSFSVRLPDISGAMLNEKLRRIMATGVDTVVTSDAGCIMHMAGGASRQGKPLRFLHLARILAGEVA
ncbi:MAG: (Fe-S)-binding protein [Chloroflexi bacterium]|nr:(Fe-S)-binding protein [Chloroflexota bacterium]